MIAHGNHIHGHCHIYGMSRTYRIWAGMKTRCLNPRRKDWKYYGGRGIKVCERWMTFQNFLLDMGECPPDGTIERIDNDGNYEPANCRWIPQAEQKRNARSNVIVEIDGVKFHLSEWARRLEVDPSYICRLRRVHGWTTKEALRYYLPL